MDAIQIGPSMTYCTVCGKPEVARTDGLYSGSYNKNTGKPYSRMACADNKCRGHATFFGDHDFHGFFIKTCRMCGESGDF